MCKDYACSFGHCNLSLHDLPCRDVYITSDLRNATHVYLHNDTVRRPLQPHYAGPFPVLQRHSSMYLVDMNGRPDTIALERLKPA